MAAWSIRNAHLHPNRQDAIQDALEMQASVAQQCVKSGKEPPPYHLLELIGKGSFGRVYKAQSTIPAQLVAVKIINIENGDALGPGADTFTDIMQEVETLKLLKHAGVKNVNIVVDALLVGHTIWMVTDYCAGGSVSTLMKSVGRLPEKWIIPLLREVTEAVFWIHTHGILHRDIKCANVLITEQGAVQLCDFGVAAILPSNLDKRSTITGSLHWMAPELFDPGVQYGPEVDIWALGSMIYEVATGLPPNASFRDIPRLGDYLRSHSPRLEGDQYSLELKDIVACCMVEDPSKRPPIDQLQRHAYIHNTEAMFPTIVLSELVHSYKLWEAQGGNRTSLFSAGGAQRDVASQPPSLDSEEWNFTLGDLDQAVASDSIGPMPQTYGPTDGVQVKPYSRHRMPQSPIARRRPVPLERLFDPYTISDYRDNSRNMYVAPWERTSSELPLRAGSDDHTIRESLIDLDAALGEDLSTAQLPAEPLIDPIDGSRRRTMDWTFPTEAATEAYPDIQHAPSSSSSDEERTLTQARLGFVAGSSQYHTTVDHRTSTLSLINLDASLPDDLFQPSRPSTAGSDAPSDMSHTPFHLERYTSESTSNTPTMGEPSTYIDTGVAPEDRQDALPGQYSSSSSQGGNSSGVQLPILPDPPATAVMLGTGSREDVKTEMLRLLSSLQDHSAFLRWSLKDLPTSSSHTG